MKTCAILWVGWSSPCDTGQVRPGLGRVEIRKIAGFYAAGPNIGRRNSPMHREPIPHSSTAADATPYNSSSLYRGV
jgi:hypothetical protein